MVKLHGRIDATAAGEPIIARVAATNDGSHMSRMNEAYLLCPSEQIADAPPGFAAILVAPGTVATLDSSSPVFAIPAELEYLAPGDIVRINAAAGEMRVLYRIKSPHNSLLLTEQCNSNCIMCSQPPKAADDSYLAKELLRAIPLMSPSTAEIGITGGEPTLLFDDLCRLLVACRDRLPSTALHVLSNGRRFSRLQFARAIADLHVPDLMLGVPLYSDLPEQHEFVVQAQGAFDETVRGLLNLGRVGVPVEIRVVIHRQTYARLPELAEFIARNLPFASHVALMGLEMMGYVRMNLDALWIDPADYQPQLRRAVETLDRAQIRTSIYNHQLCVLDRALWPFARKSISDWKREYHPVCSQCAVQESCGGFFASAKLRFSDHIRPVSVESAVAG